MSQFRCLSNLLCGLYSLMSNISYKYTVTYSICNIHALTYQLSDSRLLSDYFTVGLITGRYIFQHISRASNFSKVNDNGKLEFGNFKALLITVRVALLHARFAPFVIFQKSKDLSISLQFHISVLNKSFRIDFSR